MPARPWAVAMAAAAVAMVSLTGCGGPHRRAAIPVVAPTSSTTVENSTTAAPSTTTSTTATTIRAKPTTTAVPPPTTRVVGGTGDVKGRVIVIDPGHNGANGSHPSEINRQVDAGGFEKACDTAGTETDSGFTEAAYTFDVSTRLAAILRAAGATVILTRGSNDGVGPCIDERAAIGNRAAADVAISIHADGGPASGRGFHVIEPALVKGYTEPIVDPSRRLGGVVRDAYHGGTGMPFATYIGHDGIDVRGDLGGLNLSHVPKVFIETGNMRNATDASLLTSADFRERAAQALAAGISAYFAGR